MLSNRPRGFTLVEMMVTVAIFAIGATIAAPVFTETLDNYRLERDVRNLLEKLNDSRSTAAALRKTVTLSLNPAGTSTSSDSETDQSSDSETGQSSDNTATTNNTDLTQLYWTASAYTALKNSSLTSLRFSPTGKLSPARSLNIEVCNSDQSKSQTIVIDFTGVARLQKEVGTC